MDFELMDSEWMDFEWMDFAETSRRWGRSKRDAGNRNRS
jgi:hypothetical protein